MSRYCGRSLIANYVYHSALEMINKDLDKITAHGRWNLGIFDDLNVKAVDVCLNRLSTALEKFTVRPVSDLHGLGA